MVTNCGSGLLSTLPLKLPLKPSAGIPWAGGPPLLSAAAGMIAKLLSVSRPPKPPPPRSPLAAKKSTTTSKMEGQYLRRDISIHSRLARSLGGGSVNCLAGCACVLALSSRSGNLPQKTAAAHT